MSIVWEFYCCCCCSWKEGSFFFFFLPFYFFLLQEEPLHFDSFYLVGKNIRYIPVNLSELLCADEELKPQKLVCFAFFSFPRIDTGSRECGHSHPRKGIKQISLSEIVFFIVITIVMIIIVTVDIVVVVVFVVLLLFLLFVIIIVIHLHYHLLVLVLFLRILALVLLRRQPLVLCR